MAIFRIPNGEGQIRQINRGDIFGELWGTFNIDLTTSPGKVKTSKRLTRVLDNSELAGTFVQALIIFNGSYYCITNGKVYRCSVGDDPRVVGNWTSVSTLESEDLDFETDAVTYNGDLLISMSGDIMKWTAAGSKDDDWWTATVGGAALTGGVTHVLHVHRTGVDTLFVADGNIIRYYNPTAGHTTITLETLFKVSAFTSGVDVVWVGTYNEGEPAAFVYEVRVGDTIPTNAYPIDGRAVLAMATIDNVPYIVTDKGHIQAFNGAGFVTVQSFPFAFQSVTLDGVRPGLIQDSATLRPIHPKGMQADSTSLFIAINTRNELVFNNKVVDERSPAGVWEYDTVAGVLNHRNSTTFDANEYGRHLFDRTSPLLMVGNQYTRLMIGGSLDGTNTEGLWVEGTDTPQGYFITPEITSDTITEAYEAIVAKARTLAADDAITIKYRTGKDVNYPRYADITWLDATRFTTTDAIFGAAPEGYEIEIVDGRYAGKMAHIVKVEGATTFTVTIDESIGTLNATSLARLQNWKKISRQYTSAERELFTTSITQSAGWVQFKVVLFGDIELRQFISKGEAKSTL